MAEILRQDRALAAEQRIPLAWQGSGEAEGVRERGRGAPRRDGGDADLRSRTGGAGRRKVGRPTETLAWGEL